MYGVLRANKIKLSSVIKRFQKHIQRQWNYYHTKHIDHDRFKAQKAKEGFKPTNEQKCKLEGKIETIEDVYQVLQEELLEMANNRGLYRGLLKRSIFEGNYNNIEEFQQKIIDSEEAAKIWEYMHEFYSGLTE